VVHPRTVRSSYISGAEGAAASRVAARVRDGVAAARRRGQVVASFYCLVKMEYTDLPQVVPGSRILLLVAHLPTSTGGVDTNDKNAEIEVRWSSSPLHSLLCFSFRLCFVVIG
jgi:hypothetical protein